MQLKPFLRPTGSVTPTKHLRFKCESHLNPRRLRGLTECYTPLMRKLLTSISFSFSLLFFATNIYGQTFECRWVGSGGGGAEPVPVWRDELRGTHAIKFNGSNVEHTSGSIVWLYSKATVIDNFLFAAARDVDEGSTLIRTITLDLESGVLFGQTRNESYSADFEAECGGV